MSHRLSLSGSTIMTNPSQLTKLFRDDMDHIEIGEFPSEESFDEFLKLVREHKVSFGLHSPLYRNQSKYDLLEKVQFEPQQAWEQFENEVRYMANLGAEYVLVHFPYFKKASVENVDITIEQGLRRLSKLQDKYSIPIVCEPKLGLDRSPVGIQYLHNFPLEIWETYNLKLCIDIGDYLLAVGEKALDYISKWRDFIKVAHLHNVEFHGGEYIWVPVHPSHEGDGKHFCIKEILLFLTRCKDVHFVFEHTPHSNPTDKFVDEGIQWVRKHLLN
ncbi:sugar phosphate isomerase/epimerase family protein [Pseudalkalibacillus decolorationis]|uniref:sugar phosphate isomerase/epimerase family protein n=1 Tax=Pseudalkalibacillus decolorationis TaxID=163879 RepID=UPI0021483496|nr:sugar phosphate isomerase/epimerase [Pseudalkalibacillus decolorationis]